eukprot:XP_001696121.1 predicted protein [Chlamydomonas reinhardtii]
MQRPSAYNARVVEGISSLFGQEAHADCRIVFCLEHAEKEVNKAQASTSGRKREREDDVDNSTVGEPLPAHSFVLRFASDKLAAQLEWPTKTANGANEQERPAAKKAKGKGRKAAAKPCAAEEQQRPSPPVVEVWLGSEAELPAARAALQFAYTGRVEAGDIREALQVRRQAAYLQMEGCVEACAAAVREKLTAAGAEAVPAAGAAAASATAPAAAAAEAVLELYRCTDVWPDPADDAAFAALLTEAKRRLVAHFGDALAVLNDQTLYDQMRALPAVGLEALLESDDFGTDSESSVVLLLAE